MSGLEIVAAIASIVSAFNGSISIYRSWRDKRNERKERKENQTLERSLKKGKTTIRHEYDAHFARLGQQFAVGDAQARLELFGYIIKLQQTIMTLMTESNSTASVVLPCFPGVLESSESTRRGVLTTLGEQYQRMAQARPLLSPGSIQHSFGPQGVNVQRPQDRNVQRAPETLQSPYMPQLRSTNRMTGSIRTIEVEGRDQSSSSDFSLYFTEAIRKNEERERQSASDFSSYIAKRAREIEEREKQATNDWLLYIDEEKRRRAEEERQATDTFLRYIDEEKRNKSKREEQRTDDWVLWMDLEERRKQE